MATRIIEGLEMFSNFYARVPDSIELEHRYAVCVIIINIGCLVEC